LSLILAAGAVAPALAEGGDGGCPRAAQASAYSTYIKTTGSVAEVRAQTPAPTTTTPTAETGG
jgi:hypothetical protein